ncbi:MAG: GtrA family protein [Oscillospiraceae bacterium]|nr:GtrA family protein [Oscillospiraceae bacterium]
MKKKFLALFDVKLWKFLLVGILNTLVGNGLMFLLYNLAELGYWPSTAISYFLASVMSYFLNRHFTFKYEGGGWMVVLRFVLNIAVCYALAYGIAEPLMKWLLADAAQALRENIAMLTGMCLFVGFNYLGQRFFAFRQTKEKGE